MELIDFATGNHDATLRTKYVLVILSAFIIFRGGRASRIKVGHVAAGLLVLYACYVLFQLDTQRAMTDSTDAMTLLDKLDSEHRYTYLYMDLNLLQVLDAARGLRHLNRDTFDSLLSATNEVLKRNNLFDNPRAPIQDPMGVADTAELFANEGIAHLHALVYALPPDTAAYYTLYQSCLDDYRVMIQNHINRLFLLANQRIEARQIDVSVPPLKKTGKPRPLSDIMSKESSTATPGTTLTDAQFYFFR